MVEGCDGGALCFVDVGISGFFLRCFRFRFLICLRVENKVVKEIKVWCGEMKYEVYWFFKNILNNIF